MTGSWFLRDVHTVLCQIRTTHGSTPKQCCLLSFENWTVLDCICLNGTQFHSRSFDNVAPNESKIFHKLKNMSLIRFDLHQFVTDHSDRPVQHIQFLVQMFCCINQTYRSVWFQISLATVFQSSQFDLVLPQSQSRLHGGIHSPALICATQDCLHQVQSHCCGGGHPTVSATHCLHLAFRTLSC